MLLEITLAIIFAKVFKVLFEKLKQPGVIGEIIAGIILGPSLLGALSGTSLTLFGSSMFQLQFDLTTTEFKEIAFIGVVFLLFIVGLETNTRDLKKTKKPVLLVGIFGVIVPFLIGCLFGLLFGLTLVQSMAIGAILLATSATIAIRLLADMDMLSTRVGITLHTAIVINDILAIIIFALVFGKENSVGLLLQILLFFLLTLFAGFLLIRYSSHQSTKRKTPLLVITSGLVICFLFAAFAENMGLTAIIGAFIAGIIIRKTPQANILAEYIKTIGYAFFIPIFFVSVGASFDFLYLLRSDSLSSLAFFMVFFVLFGLVGNFLGGGIGARLAGLSKHESISVGVGMMPVMGVALIIVTTGIDRGIFGPPTGLLANQIRAATLLLIIISALITPPLMKKTMQSPLSRILGKTKTKLSHYSHPHCPACFSALRLEPQSNEWYCDYCQSMTTRDKATNRQALSHGRKTDTVIMYFIGAGTILLCAYAIQHTQAMVLSQKISAMIGIFLGTTLGFLLVKYLFSSKTHSVS